MSIQMYEYRDLVKTLTSDIKRGRKISFLLGSAVSNENGLGFPNVKQMLEIIKEYLVEVEMYDEEAEVILNKSGTEAYQDIYEYIFKTGGDQKDIRILMERYLSFARDCETENWKLTTCLIELSKYIIENGAIVENILTTNFDPFIEFALRESNKNIISHSLDYNSNINSILNVNNNNINIVHLHGFYKNDTMHTKAQLESVRPKVKESIKTILSKSDNLYVFGYSGWDDIFINSLKDIVEEFDATYNIRWAFYSNSDGDILYENRKILEIVVPAIAKGRFHPYKSIDCHKIFKDINSSLISVSNFSDDISIKKKKNDKNVRTININQVFNPKSKKTDDKFTLIPFTLPHERSHELIRLFEQHCANQYLFEDGGFVLESGWGYGKLGFLSSVIYADDSEHDKIIVRSDLSNIETKRDAEQKIIEDIGLDISTLLALQFEKSFFIIIDNIDNPDPTLLHYLHEISSLFKDSDNNSKLILISNKKISLSLKSIKLKQLDLDDIKEYLSTDHKTHPLQNNEIDKIYLLTSGMPIKLDKIQEYQNIMSLSDVLEEDVIEVTSERLHENVPKHLLDKVNSLESSENLTNRRIFKLLSIFSVLECGETAKNIKRHFYEHDFKLEDFQKLVELNLVNSIEKNDFGQLVILKINILIKDYIRSKITNDSVIEIIHKSMSLIYGRDWESITVKINQTIKTMLLYQDFFPGNAHILTLQYLKHCFIYDTQNKTKLTKLCVAYCMYLNNKDRFKELVSFSEGVYKFLKKYESEDLYDVLYYYAEGSRMVGSGNLTVELLKEKLSVERKEITVSNTLYNKLLSTYMLALKDQNEDEALIIANKLYDLAPNRSHYHYQSKNVITSSNNNKRIKIKELKKLEKEARNDGCILAANNICLELENLVSDDNDKYLKIVLDTEEYTYTKVRALLSYARKLYRTNPDKIMVGGVLPSLVDAYRYLFLQRISMFNSCHDVLWDIFKKFGKFNDLYQLYRTSSILWRLNGDHSREYKYAVDLVELVNIETSIDSQYIQFINRRYTYLNQNKDVLAISDSNRKSTS